MQVEPLESQREAVINNALATLSSFDLIRQVADTIGPGKILGNNQLTHETSKAATVIQEHLILDALPHSDIIRI